VAESFGVTGREVSHHLFDPIDKVSGDFLRHLRFLEGGHAPLPNPPPKACAGGARARTRWIRSSTHANGA
jgi:hypothetical protein